MFRFARTISFKLTAWFVSILAFTILSVSALFYVGMERIMLQAVDANLRVAGQRSVVPPNTTEGPSQNGDSSDQLRQLILLNDTPARLLLIDGSPLQSDPLFPAGVSVTPAMLASANQGSARFETLSLPTGIYRLYTAPVRIHDTRVAIVQVIVSLNDQMRTLSDMRMVLEWLIPISLILAGLGGAFLSGRALEPITRVRRNVEKIIDMANLSQRVSEGLPDDDVGRLARTFDQLLERVQHAMSRERQFTSDASHELRTPLTVLKGEISVALSRPRSAREYRQTLTQLESTVDDMSRLVEDLLTLSRAAANKENTGLERLNLSELVQQVCERMRVLADTQGIALNAPDKSTVYVVMGDRLKLQRVFTNLIDNALRYTPKGGRVDIDYKQKDTAILVGVHDTGRGIRPEHLPRLFQRFYRADVDRARDSGGSGLGLAIAQAIVQSHNGRILVESRPGKGSCFTVSLPLVAVEPAQAAPVSPPSTSAVQLAIAAHTPAQASARIELHDRTFRAMNTGISLLLMSSAHHAALALDAAEWFFLQTEWRLSRFRESSELSTLNRQGSIRASHMLFEVVRLAAQAYHESNGVFNPLVGHALAVAGYDRTFDEIGTDTQLQHTGGTAAAAPPLDEVLLLDPTTREIQLRDGAQLDLGGIAKGWAIDRTFRTLSKLGDCCVNAGGDVRAGGSFEPGGDGWRVDIADPFAQPVEDSPSPPSVRAVMVKDAAIATSGIVRRRWMMDGVEQHHLIDPRNGLPARNDLYFVSTIASTTIQAEVAAKVVYILGEEAGFAWTIERQIPAFFMRRNGEYVTNEWFHTI